MWGPRMSPWVLLGGGHPRGEVETLHRRAGLQRGEDGRVGRLTDGDHAAHHAGCSQVPSETSRINSFQQRNLRRLEVAREVALSSPVRVGTRNLTTDTAA